MPLQDLYAQLDRTRIPFALIVDGCLPGSQAPDGAYLRTGNAVVLAAKPGAFAEPWPNPDVDWGEVGPLSARITNYVRASVWDPDPLTLGEVLSNVTDYKRVGEISSKGSISWSDFAVLKKATMDLKLRDPGGR